MCVGSWLVLSARLLLVLLEECNPDANNDRAAHGSMSSLGRSLQHSAVGVKTQHSGTRVQARPFVHRVATRPEVLSEYKMENENGSTSETVQFVKPSRENICPEM